MSTKEAKDAYRKLIDNGASPDEAAAAVEGIYGVRMDEGDTGLDVWDSPDADQPDMPEAYSRPAPPTSEWEDWGPPMLDTEPRQPDIEPPAYPEKRAGLEGAQAAAELSRAEFDQMMARGLSPEEAQDAADEAVAIFSMTPTERAWPILKEAADAEGTSGDKPLYLFVRTFGPRLLDVTKGPADESARERERRLVNARARYVKEGHWLGSDDQPARVRAAGTGESVFAGDTIMEGVEFRREQYREMLRLDPNDESAREGMRKVYEAMRAKRVQQDRESSSAVADAATDFLSYLLSASDALGAGGTSDPDELARREGQFSEASREQDVFAVMPPPGAPDAEFEIAESVRRTSAERERDQPGEVARELGEAPSALAGVLKAMISRSSAVDVAGGVTGLDTSVIGQGAISPNIEAILPVLEDASGDEIRSALRSLRYDELPPSMRGVAPSRANIPMRDLPLDEFDAAIDVSPEAVAAALKLRESVMEATGRESLDELGEAMEGAMLDHPVEGVVQHPVESTFGWITNVPASVATEIILEADVGLPKWVADFAGGFAMGPEVVAAGAELAAGDSSRANRLLRVLSGADKPSAAIAGWTQALRDARLPTAAGIDFMLSSDAPAFRWARQQVGVRPDYSPLREFDEDAGFWTRTFVDSAARVAANIDTGAPGAQGAATELAFNAGFSEDSPQYRFASQVGVALDWLFPWEEVVGGFVTQPATRTYRATKASRMAGKGRKLKSGVAAFSPSSYVAYLHVTNDPKLNMPAVDADVPSVLAAIEHEVTMRESAKGRNALAAHGGQVNSLFDEAARMIGVSPVELRAKYAQDMETRARQHLELTREIMEGPSNDPEIQKLRSTEGYVEFRRELERMQMAGNLSDADVLHLMGLAEIMAAKSGDMESWFSRQTVVFKREAGPEVKDLPDSVYAQPDDPARGSGVEDAATAGAPVDEAEQAAQVWAEQGTDSPWFRRWFGDSKVVDADGKPLVVYHGTTADFDTFNNPYAEDVGDGGWFMVTEDPEYANAHVLYASKPRVMPLHVKAENPFDISDLPVFERGVSERVLDRLRGIGIEPDDFTNPGEHASTTYNTINQRGFRRDLRRALEANGYDSIKMPDRQGGVDAVTWVLFKPEQIKSVTANRGTFDPKDARLLYDTDESGRAAGSFQASAAGRPVSDAGYYSALRDAVASQKQDRFSADQLRGVLRKAPGVKADEIEWTRLDQFLNENPKPTKQDVLDWLDENAVQVEVVKKDFNAQSLPPNDAIRNARAIIRAAGLGEGAIHALEADPSGAANAIEALSQDVVPDFAYGYTDGEWNDGPDRAAVIASRSRILVEVFDEEFAASTKAAAKVVAAVAPEDLDAISSALIERAAALKESLAGARTDIGVPDALPRWGEYVQPGDMGNYREVLLTFPTEAAAADVRLQKMAMSDDVDTAEVLRFADEREPYKNLTYHGPHWDEPNVIAHIRLSDRTGIDGERVLFIEEIQSDWHQEGRQKGYANDKHVYDVVEIDHWGEPAYTVTRDGETMSWSDLEESSDPHGADAFQLGQMAAWSSQEAAESFAQELPTLMASEKVPAGPFSKSWPDLALKQVLRIAVDGDYDAIAFASGEDVARVVGGEEAGQAEFYDSILPKRAAKLVKGDGSSVSSIALDLDGEVDVKAISVTDKMRDRITSEGQPLFQSAGGKARGTFQPRSRAGYIEPTYDVVDAAGTIIAEGVSKAEADEINNSKVGNVNIVEATEGRVPGLGDRSFLTTLYESAGPDTVVHESGHLMAELMREFDPDTYKSLAKSLGEDPNMPGHLSRAGHERFAEAWRWYVRTRSTSSGRVKRAFDKLWHTGIRDGWMRMRGTPEAQNLPREALSHFDTVFRPDKLASAQAMLVENKPTQARIQKVRVSADPHDQALEGRVRRAGAAREAGRIDFDRDGILHDTGLRAGDSVDTDVMVASILSYVQAQRSRTIFGQGEMVRLTTRTIVPAARAPRVQRRAKKMLTQALGEDPIKLGKRARKGKRSHVILTAAQQDGIRRLADQVAAEPMGNAVPARLLDPTADLSRVEFDDWNRLIEATIDVQSGISARRSRKAEAVPQHVSYALWNALSEIPGNLKNKKLADGVATARSRIKRMFITEKLAEGYIDPGIRETIESHLRKLGDAQAWVKRNVRALKDGSTTVRQTLGDVAGLLTPPVRLHLTNALYRTWTAFGGEGGTLKVSALLTTERMNDLLDSMMEGAPLTDQEAAAIQALRMRMADMEEAKRIGPDEVDALTQELSEDAKFSDAINVLQRGVQRRWERVDQRATAIAIAIAGGQGDNVDVPNILVNLTPRERLDVYEMFYDGRWMPEDGGITRDGKQVHSIASWAANRGLEFADSERHLKRARRVDTDVAFIEMITRLRALEVMESLAEDMAAHDIMADLSELTKDQALGSMEDRNQFYDNVLHYLNNETSAKGVDVWSAPTEDGPGGPVVTNRPPPGGHDMAAFTYAQDILNRWDWPRGPGGVWVRKTLPDGSDTLVPDMVARAIDQHLAESSKVGTAYGSARADFSSEPAPAVTIDGAVTRAKVAETARGTVASAINTIFSAFDNSMSALRLGLTVGPIGVMAPAYFVTNFMGAAMQAHLGLGAGRTAKMAVTDVAPTMAVMHRLFTDSEVGIGGNTSIITKTGQVYTADMLAKMAREQGLDSSFIKAETQRSLALDIKRMHRKGFERIKNAPGAYNEWMTRSATACDNFWRVSTFIDALKRGDSPAAAAELARKVGFDYGDLTDFEKRVMRQAMLFYSYTRRNQSLFWDTLFTNPSRVAGYLRLSRGLTQHQMEEFDQNPEITIPRHYQGRLMLEFKRSTVSTHRTAGYAFFAPPTPVNEATGLWLGLTDAVAIGDDDAIGDLVARSNPLLQAAFVRQSHIDPFTGRDVTDPRNPDNIIPAALIDRDQSLTNGWMKSWFGARLKYEDDPSYWPSGGEGYVWRATGEGVYAWWAWRNLAAMVPGGGRSLDTMVAADRAQLPTSHWITQEMREIRQAGADTGLLDEDKERRRGDPMGPRVGLSAAEELLSYLGFAKPGRIPTEEAVLESAEKDAIKKMKDRRREASTSD